MNCQQLHILLLKSLEDGFLDIWTPEVKQHVESCSACSERVEHIRTLQTQASDASDFSASVMQALESTIDNTQEPKRSTTLLVSMLAAASIIIALGIWFSGWLDDDSDAASNSGTLADSQVIPKTKGAVLLYTDAEQQRVLSQDVITLNPSWVTKGQTIAGQQLTGVGNSSITVKTANRETSIAMADWNDALMQNIHQEANAISKSISAGHSITQHLPRLQILAFLGDTEALHALEVLAENDDNLQQNLDPEVVKAARSLRLTRKFTALASSSTSGGAQQYEAIHALGNIESPFALQQLKTFASGSQEDLATLAYQELKRLRNQFQTMVLCDLAENAKLQSIRNDANRLKTLLPETR